MFGEGYRGYVFTSRSETVDYYFRNKNTKCCFVLQLCSPLCFLISTEMCLSRNLRMQGSYRCCSQAIDPERKGFADTLSSWDLLLHGLTNSASATNREQGCQCLLQVLGLSRVCLGTWPRRNVRETRSRLSSLQHHSWSSLHLHVGFVVHAQHGCFTPSCLGRCSQIWCGSGHPSFYLPWWQHSR